MSCPLSELFLTYLLNARCRIFIQLPPTEERRVELPNVTFLPLFHFLKHCLSCPRQAPTLRCGLVKLTLKRPT